MERTAREIKTDLDQAKTDEDAPRVAELEQELQIRMFGPIPTHAQEPNVG